MEGSSSKLLFEMSLTNHLYETIGTVKLDFVLTVMVAMLDLMVMKMNLCYGNYVKIFID